MLYIKKYKRTLQTNRFYSYIFLGGTVVLVILISFLEGLRIFNIYIFLNFLIKPWVKIVVFVFHHCFQLHFRSFFFPSFSLSLSTIIFNLDDKENRKPNLFHCFKKLLGVPNTDNLNPGKKREKTNFCP